MPTDDNIERQTSQENATSPPPHQKEAEPQKRRKMRWWWKLLLFILLSPFVLFLLALIIIYLPPVQQYAVEKAGEALSKQMGLDVQVGSVNLAFPLDLRMLDVVAVDNGRGIKGETIVAPESRIPGLEYRQKGDTILAIKRLDLNIQLLPLFKQKVEVDAFTIYGAKVNTKELISALTVKGEIGELYVDAHNIDLDQSLATMSKTYIANADLTLSLADSVPPDTTPSTPTPWKVTLENVMLHNVALQVKLPPQANRTSVSADISDGYVKGVLDLENSRFLLRDIELRRSMARFDTGADDLGDHGYRFTHHGRFEYQGDPSSLAFNSNHIIFEDLTTHIDTLHILEDGQLRIDISQLQGNERSGLAIDHFNGVLTIDSTALHIHQSHLLTAQTNVEIDFDMDMNAFDEHNPGTVSARVKGTVNKNDLAPLTTEVPREVMDALPDKAILVDADVSGNLSELAVNKLHTSAQGLFEMDADGILMNLNDPKALAMNARFKGHITDAAFVKKMMPADAAQSVNIPHDMTVEGRFGMVGDELTADVSLQRGASLLKLNAGYVAAKESYNIDLDAMNLRVNDFVALTDELLFTGRVKAVGHGMDIYSDKMTADVDIDIQQGHFGKIDFTKSLVEGTLKDGQFNGYASVDNAQTQLVADLEGMIGERYTGGQSLLAGSKGHSTGFGLHGTLHLPHTDLYAMGLSDSPLSLSAETSFNFDTDGRHTIRLVGLVEEGEVRMGNDVLPLHGVMLNAETTPEKTKAIINNKDLSLYFSSPHYFETITRKFSDFQAEIDRQKTSRVFDAERARNFLPETFLNLRAGNDNPLSELMRMRGISWTSVDASFDTSPEFGLEGDGVVTDLRAQNDSLIFDELTVKFYEDSLMRLKYEARANALSMTAYTPFTATIDGYLEAKNIDTHIKLFNAAGMKAFDLGAHLEGRDSLAYVTLYPSHPTIGFTEYEINDDNYIILTRKNSAQADIRLRGVDGTWIDITGAPNDTLLQNLHFDIRHLNMTTLTESLPFVPQMKGTLNMDADYQQTEASFHFGGKVQTRQFFFEDTELGDMDALVDYEPLDNNRHSVHAVIFKNDTETAVIDGIYTATDGGRLDMTARLNHLPMGVASPFIAGSGMSLEGTASGLININGPTDKLSINGGLAPDGLKLNMPAYGVTFRFPSDTIHIADNTIRFDNYMVYGHDDTPLTLNGNIDFSDFANVTFNLNAYGRNFALINARKTRESLVYGKMFADLFAQVVGNPNEITVRGLVNVLRNTDVKYVLVGSPITVEDRLSDIVTFVDFSAPPPKDQTIVTKVVTGIDMRMNLTAEEGAKFKVELSTDESSFVNIEGNGTLNMMMTPQGVFSLQGRYTLSGGLMKYQLPVIPLKTFQIQKGSYVDFTGDPGNPILNITATERTRTSVAENDGGSRTVAFDTGVKVTGTLNDMNLEFIIDAPEDQYVQSDLSTKSPEEKNKIAVAMLATGMYLTDTNTAGFKAANALNSYLENEINQIVNRATNSYVDVSVGINQTENAMGRTHTDYSFRFSKRLLSDRLNVIIGGKVSADKNSDTQRSGAYIDDVSLEWRLDDGGTRYLRVFHEQKYANPFEGEVVANGGGIILRKKVDNFTDLFIFRKEENRRDSLFRTLQNRASQQTTTPADNSSQEKVKEDSSSLPTDDSDNKEDEGHAPAPMVGGDRQREAIPSDNPETLEE